MADEKNEDVASETPAPKPEPIRDLADLGAATQLAAAAASGAVAPATPVSEPEAVDVAPTIDAQGRSYANVKMRLPACGLSRVVVALTSMVATSKFISRVLSFGC